MNRITKSLQFLISKYTHLSRKACNSNTKTSKHNDVRRRAYSLFWKGYWSFNKIAFC